MAVAAHVSRVSKEYAPFGYSIMESISVPFTLVAGTDVYIPLAYAEDADLYLEAASLVALTAFGSEGTNFWTFSLVHGPSGLASEIEVSHADIGGASTLIGVNTINDFAIDVPIIPQGRALYLKADAAASAAIESVAAVIRIRRKA